MKKDSNSKNQIESKYVHGIQDFVKKIIHIIVVLLSVSFLTFLLMDLAPGEPGTSMYDAAGIIPTEEMLALTREQLGLNQPLMTRYFSWLVQCIQGDLGTSFSQHDEVKNLISKNMKSTLTMAFSILALTLLFSIPLGVLSAVARDKIPDHLVRFLSFIGISAPNFLVALILTYVISYQLGWLPVYNPYGSKTAYILPVLTMVIGMTGNYTRQIRALFLEELSQDYVYGARARGVSEIKILSRHVMRNTLLPLTTLIAFSLGSLLGGVAIVEVIFSFPGIGNLLIYAVDMRDYPLIQGLVLWIALCYTLLNVFSDLLYPVFDPRLKKSS
ncbi:MAG: ABC transporter permease [Eubacteriales bacterium]